ncbi:hypothetical protein JCGZ_12689 [Jatropha curcas]|uniref:Uncharacterized protein n=1 Tax=Jatropha curcas TaxID=180498 RepID=A0A067KHC4_JATCU|nr:hypothetical protein JCGZ_12689 [Jatropha curcas]
MTDNHGTRLTAIEARFEELAEQIRQLTLAIQQGNPQPATAIANPNPHQLDYARRQNRYDGGRDYKGHGDNFQDGYEIKSRMQDTPKPEKHKHASVTVSLPVLASGSPSMPVPVKHVRADEPSYDLSAGTPVSCQAHPC